MTQVVSHFQFLVANTASRKDIIWSVFLGRAGMLACEQDSSSTTFLCRKTVDMMRGCLSLRNYFRFATIHKFSKPNKRAKERHTTKHQCARYTHTETHTHTHTQNENISNLISILER